MEWSVVEGSEVECSVVEWSGVEWSKVEWSGCCPYIWSSRKEQEEGTICGAGRALAGNQEEDSGAAGVDGIGGGQDWRWTGLKVRQWSKGDEIERTVNMIVFILLNIQRNYESILKL